MNDLMKRITTNIHAEYLKTMGFKKNRQRFCLTSTNYIVHLDFQSSSWNTLRISSIFYLNIGVQFTDLPPNPYWTGIPDTHWAGRIHSLVSSAPHQWKCDEKTDIQSLIREIAGLITQGLTEIQKRATDMKQEYLVYKAEVDEKVRTGRPN